MLSVIQQIISWIVDLFEAIVSEIVQLAGILLGFLPSSPSFVDDVLSGLEEVLVVMMSYDWLLPISEFLNITVFILDMVFVFIVALVIYWTLVLAMKLAQIIRG